MPSKITPNPAWRQKMIARLTVVLDEITLRIEAEAKRELYPGHGKLTGRLQRSITAEPARIDGDRIIGRVATKGVPYARRINRLYRYFPIAVRRVRTQVPSIVKRHQHD